MGSIPSLAISTARRLIWSLMPHLQCTSAHVHQLISAATDQHPAQMRARVSASGSSSGTAYHSCRTTSPFVLVEPCAFTRYAGTDRRNTSSVSSDGSILIRGWSYWCQQRIRIDMQPQSATILPFPCLFCEAKLSCVNESLRGDVAAMVR